MTTSNDPHGGRVPSPCVRNCCLDDDNVCMGCGRSVAEIVGWSGATDEARKAVLYRSRRRMALRQSSPLGARRRSDQA